MGKAADNEQTKIVATFLNNMSVGLYLGGGFLPVLSLYRYPLPSLADWRDYLLPVLGSLLLVIFGSMAHRRAIKVLEKIED